MTSVVGDMRRGSMAEGGGVPGVDSGRGAAPLMRLHNVATVDDLFRNYPITTARSVLSSTRLQAAEKREELRQVTAEHYRDLITCTENVKMMHFGISRLMENMARIAGESRELAITRDVEPPSWEDVEEKPVEVTPELELGRQLKRLLAMMEEVWRKMEDRDFAGAARYYLVDLPQLREQIASLRAQCPDTKLPVEALLQQQDKAGRDVPETIVLTCKQALGSLELTAAEMRECVAVLMLMDKSDGEFTEEAMDRLVERLLEAREGLILGAGHSVIDRVCALEATLRIASSGICSIDSIMSCAKENGLFMGVENFEARGNFSIDRQRQQEWEKAVLDSVAREAEKCGSLGDLTTLRNRSRDRLGEYMRTFIGSATEPELILWPALESSFQRAGMALLKRGLPKSDGMTQLTEALVESLESSACDSKLWREPRAVVTDAVAEWLSERCDDFLAANLVGGNFEDVRAVALYSSAVLGYQEDSSLCAEKDISHIVSSEASSSCFSGDDSALVSFACRPDDGVGRIIVAAVSGDEGLSEAMQRVCEKATREWCDEDLLAHVEEETAYQTAWRVSSALLSAGSSSTSRVLSIIRARAVEKWPDRGEIVRYLDGGLEDSRSGLLFAPLRGERKKGGSDEEPLVATNVDAEPAFASISIARFSTLPVASGRAGLSTRAATPKTAVEPSAGVKTEEGRVGASKPYDFASFFSQMGSNLSHLKVSYTEGIKRT